ncbi:MAG: alpha/beta fold hydrolase, partial [Deltaproteobacteria bacterium]|nr:alpha/beta fold hydrolase [Deltaproteobacteria bacterium]
MRTAWLKRKVIVVFVAAFVGWLGISFTLYLMSGRIIYQPELGADAKYSIPFELEYVQNGEGDRIEMMWIPKGEDWKQEKTFLYLHGNVGRLSYIVEELSKRGNVLSPSYPGFSGSEGKSNTEKIYEVVDLSIAFLNNKGVKDGDIVVLGHSLGGSPAVYAATKYPDLDEVILVNTFYSLKEMCRVSYPGFCIFAGGFHDSAAIAPHAKARIRQFHNVSD